MLFQNTDWNHVRRLLDQHPERREAINGLMDEMHAYDLAVFAKNRGSSAELPERPDVVTRIQQITQSAPVSH